MLLSFHNYVGCWIREGNEIYEMLVTKMCGVPLTHNVVLRYHYPRCLSNGGSPIGQLGSVVTYHFKTQSIHYRFKSKYGHTRVRF